MGHDRYRGSRDHGRDLHRKAKPVNFDSCGRKGRERTSGRCRRHPWSPKTMRSPGAQDARERFTEFVKRIAKAGPQYRVKKEIASGRGKRPPKPYRGETQPRERKSFITSAACASARRIAM